MRTAKVVAAVGVLAVLVGSGSAAARAAQQAQGTTQGTSGAAMAPDTAEQHEARAEAYRAKAQSARREAEEHRKMLAEYKARQSSPALETKLGQEPPWVKKMRKHCESYITAANNMAAEAESFAEFHHMRAEELRGK